MKLLEAEALLLVFSMLVVALLLICNRLANNCLGISMMNNFNAVALIVVGVSLLSASNANAQAHYDNHELKETFSLSIGGYRQVKHDTKIRLDSRELGIGTIIDLEDGLKVDKETGSIFRLDGFYRFNREHRVEWSWYGSKREGVSEIIGTELQIGDEIFEIGDIVESKTRLDVVKVGWSWSYINVEPYEFYIGAGLNINNSKLSFKNTLSSGGGTELEEFTADGTLPLPTLTFGGRINFSEDWMLKVRYELFALSIGDYDGRLQQSHLHFEHNTFENIGFGAGVTNYMFNVEAEDDEYLGEVESTYLGLFLYMKTYF